MQSDGGRAQPRRRAEEKRSDDHSGEPRLMKLVVSLSASGWYSDFVK